VELLERRMAERRERILAAAREIIAEGGFEGLTMRALARASRVTVPTIYNLIGSRDRVLIAAVEEQTERFLAGIEAGEHATPAARLLSVVEACVRELLRQPRYYRSLLRLLASSPEAAKVRTEVGRTLARELGRGLDDLRDAGELVGWVEDAALLHRLVAHLAFTSLQWADGELSNDALRAATVYETSLVLVAVTSGGSRREFERTARQAQGRVASRRLASTGLSASGGAR
jgi:AcrR family transcriptional regulator